MYSHFYHLFGIYELTGEHTKETDFLFNHWGFLCVKLIEERAVDRAGEGMRVGRDMWKRGSRMDGNTGQRTRANLMEHYLDYKAICLTERLLWNF